MMLSVSLATAFARPGADKLVYLKQQAVVAGLGLVLMLVISRLDYRKWGKISVVGLGAIILSLLAIHLPGLSRSANGSARWIPLGPYNFQPSEFAKLLVVLAGAHLLASKRARAGDSKSLMLPFGILAFAVCGLVLLAPDLGTALIIAGLAMGLLWIAGMKSAHWIGLGATGGALALILTVSSKYREARLLAFINPFADRTGKGFQLVESLLALGRGGWLGQGPGASIQQFGYLPNAHTDMILAILGEEFGLLGVGLVILLFALLAYGAWRLARRCSDPLGKYLIVGCSLLVTLEAAVNVGGVLSALPLTGVPLPFISFGSNDLLVMLAAVGVVLSVGRFASASGRATLVSPVDDVRQSQGPRTRAGRRPRPSAG
jgi:cell division protein FtsW